VAAAPLLLKRRNSNASPERLVAGSREGGAAALRCALAVCDAVSRVDKFEVEVRLFAVLVSM
jgi:hypothetical protein